MQKHEQIKSLHSIQKTVAEFADRLNLSNEVHARLLDLASEVGELSKEYNKITGYGKRPFSVHEDFVMELGDVLFCLLLIANLSGIALEDLFAEVMAKMEERAKKKEDIGSGR